MWQLYQHTLREHGVIPTIVECERLNALIAEDSAPLMSPLRIEAERGGRIVAMPVEAPTACALCHSVSDSVGGALGLIRAPCPLFLDAELRAAP